MEPFRLSPVPPPTSSPSRGSSHGRSSPFSSHDHFHEPISSHTAAPTALSRGSGGAAAGRSFSPHHPCPPPPPPLSNNNNNGSTFAAAGTSKRTVGMSYEGDNLALPPPPPPPPSGSSLVNTFGRAASASIGGRPAAFLVENGRRTARCVQWVADDDSDDDDDDGVEYVVVEEQQVAERADLQQPNPLSTHSAVTVASCGSTSLSSSFTGGVGGYSHTTPHGTTATSPLHASLDGDEDDAEDNEDDDSISVALSLCQLGVRGLNTRASMTSGGTPSSPTLSLITNPTTAAQGGGPSRGSSPQQHAVFVPYVSRYRGTVQSYAKQNHYMAVPDLSSKQQSTDIDEGLMQKPQASSTTAAVGSQLRSNNNNFNSVSLQTRTAGATTTSPKATTKGSGGPSVPLRGVIPQQLRPGSASQRTSRPIPASWKKQRGLSVDDSDDDDD